MIITAWCHVYVFIPVTFTTGGENQVTCKGFLIVAHRNVTGELMNVVGAGFVPARNRNAKYQLSNCFPQSVSDTLSDLCPIALSFD